jgi:DNA-binding IclR family transcriptional regulator
MLATRPSPGTTRAVGILNFLAEHPRQSFKLSDLQRALHVSRTTCHATLLALLEAGYVHRGSDKSYALGPALVDIGRAASASLSPLQIAQPEMRKLADKYDVICSAVFIDGNDMVVRDRATSVSHIGFSAPRGIRLPMIGPAAAIQFAWAKPSQFKTWLTQQDPPPTAADRRHIDQAIEFVKKHRFGFGSIFLNSGGPLDSNWKRDDSSRPPYKYATTLEQAEEYQVGVLQSWVFDSRGRMEFALTLTGMSRPLSASEILQRGNELREACDRVTASTGGRWPQGWDEPDASEA